MKLGGLIASAWNPCKLAHIGRVMWPHVSVIEVRAQVAVHHPTSDTSEAQGALVSFRPRIRACASDGGHDEVSTGGVQVRCSQESRQ